MNIFVYRRMGLIKGLVHYFRKSHTYKDRLNKLHNKYASIENFRSLGFKYFQNWHRRRQFLRNAERLGRISNKLNPWKS